jgi:hypothetical protein
LAEHVPNSNEFRRIPGGKAEGFRQGDLEKVHTIADGGRHIERSSGQSAVASETASGIDPDLGFI